MAKLATLIDTIGEHLALFVPYDGEVAAHRDFFDVNWVRGGDFERREVHSLYALAPAEQATLIINGTWMSASTHFDDIAQSINHVKA